MCIEREKDNFKSREVNCLKECALALKSKKKIFIPYITIEWQTSLHDERHE